MAAAAAAVAGAVEGSGKSGVGLRTRRTPTVQQTAAAESYLDQVPLLLLSVCACVGWWVVRI